MKRLLAAALAAALVLTSAPAVSHAAVTVQQTQKADLEAGKDVTVTDGDTTYGLKKAGDGVTVTSVQDTKTTKTLKVVAADGLNITSFKASAFKGTKAKTIDLTAIAVTKLNKNQFKGSKAKTVKINATKLKAKSINKKALKGFKGKKVVLTAKHKKAFNALVKKLKKSAGKNVKFTFKKAK